jgi:cyanophycinase
VIPTAGTGESYGDFWPGLQRLRDAGATRFSVLHTRDRQQADGEEFVAPLRQARGVWFSGGRRWQLVDAYLGTRTVTEIRGVLERGGVVGGSSARATIQESFLVRGDASTKTIMMGDLIEVINAHPSEFYPQIPPLVRSALSVGMTA